MSPTPRPSGRREAPGRVRPSAARALPSAGLWRRRTGPARPRAGSRARVGGGGGSDGGHRDLPPLPPGAAPRPALPSPPPPPSPAPTSWLKAFTASMLAAAAADAGGRPRGGGNEGRGRRGGSVPLRGCARTWPFGGGGARALPCPSLAPSVRRLAGRAPAQTVSPSGMAEPTPRTAPWDRAGLPAPRHPQEREGGGGGKEEGGREGGSARAARRGHHVTRGRVTPRAPPCQRRPRPRGGEMAGLTPPARQSPAGLGRVLGSAVASLSRWVGSRVWTEPGGSAAPPLEGGRSSCGVVGVAGAACAGTAWLGSARLREEGAGQGRAGQGTARVWGRQLRGAGEGAAPASMFTLKNWWVFNPL